MGSIPVELWGSAMWRTVHAVALGHDARYARLTGSSPPPTHADNSDADNAADAAYLCFFDSLGHVLPCDQCRTGFPGDTPAQISEAMRRRELFAWSVALHNRVNAKLGRPQVTAAEARVGFYAGDAAAAAAAAGRTRADVHYTKLEPLFESLTIAVLVVAFVAGGVAWWQRHRVDLSAAVVVVA